MTVLIIFSISVSLLLGIWKYQKKAREIENAKS